MHPVSILTVFIFLAGYISARWDLFQQLIELSVFAWDHSVIVRLRPHSALYHAFQHTNLQSKTRAAKGFAILSIFFILILIPIERIAAREAELVSLPAVTVTVTTLPKRGPHSDRVLQQQPRTKETGISAREQLRRRGSF